MKKINNNHRLQAIDILVNDSNSILLSKDEIILGIKTILKQKTLYPEAKKLVDIASNKINKQRGVK